MPAADGVAVHHGDDGLWQRAYLLLHVEDVEPGHAVAAHVAAAALDVHIAARAESLVAGTREHHDADVLTFAAISQRLAHLPHCERRERVAIARAVDRDAGDAVELVKEYFLVFLDSFPVSHRLEVFLVDNFFCKWVNAIEISCYTIFIW